VGELEVVCVVASQAGEADRERGGRRRKPGEGSRNKASQQSVETDEERPTSWITKEKPAKGERGRDHLHGVAEFRIALVVVLLLFVRRRLHGRSRPRRSASRPDPTEHRPGPVLVVLGVLLGESSLGVLPMVVHVRRQAGRRPHDRLRASDLATFPPSTSVSARRPESVDVPSGKMLRDAPMHVRGAVYVLRREVLVASDDGTSSIGCRQLAGMVVCGRRSDVGQIEELRDDLREGKGFGGSARVGDEEKVEQTGRMVLPNLGDDRRHLDRLCRQRERGGGRSGRDVGRETKGRDGSSSDGRGRRDSRGGRESRRGGGERRRGGRRRRDDSRGGRGDCVLQLKRQANARAELVDVLLDGLVLRETRSTHALVLLLAFFFQHRVDLLQLSIGFCRPRRAEGALPSGLEEGLDFDKVTLANLRLDKAGEGCRVPEVSDRVGVLDLESGLERLVRSGLEKSCPLLKEQEKAEADDQRWR
jgi:hypothetical protein